METGPVVRFDYCQSSALEKRDDDSEEIAIKRYETYEKNIKQVIDFYNQSNLLKVVNGE